MRAVIQRTIRSSVTSEGTETGRIGAGLTVLLGVGRDDDEKDVVYTADKILNLRIFEDEEGKMNQSLLQKGGEMLVVSPVRRCTSRTQTEFYGSSASGFGEPVI